jgi:tetratricopeptide (TPR) repeat protein
LQSDAHRKEGNRLLARGDLPGAEACYRRSVAADPRSADAHVALGFALLQQEKLSEAKSLLEAAVALDQRNVDGHYLLAMVAQKQDRSGDAIACFNKALAINPGFVDALHGLGVALRNEGRLDEALRSFDRALAIQPGFGPSRFSKSLLLLLLGDFARGLELFESRLDVCEEKQLLDWLAFLSRHPEKPRWQGEDLRGKRLLVWTEQGAGDAMMMARYLPRLADKGVGSILVLCDPGLKRLFEALPVGCRVYSRAEDLSPDKYDMHCSMMSLPYLFGTRLDTIPGVVPYLFVPEGLREEWSRRLAVLNGVKVGVAWAGNPKYGRDFLRSVAFRELGPLFAVPGVAFVSLQKGVAAEALPDSDRAHFDCVDEGRDFMDTAAMVLNLDLVVSVDTSLCHLAGALGRPVWLLNRFESEWRWLLERDTSPWYPSMRIFRQTVAGDWPGVARRLAAELGRLAVGGVV